MWVHVDIASAEMFERLDRMYCCRSLFPDTLPLYSKKARQTEERLEFVIFRIGEPEMEGDKRAIDFYSAPTDDRQSHFAGASAIHFSPAT